MTQPSPYSNNHAHGCQCTTCDERRRNAGFLSAEIGRSELIEWPVAVDSGMTMMGGDDDCGDLCECIDCRQRPETD